MTTITVEEIKARMDAGETLNLVDVREPAEHAEFNIFICLSLIFYTTAL